MRISLSSTNYSSYKMIEWSPGGYQSYWPVHLYFKEVLNLLELCEAAIRKFSICFTYPMCSNRCHHRRYMHTYLITLVCDNQNYILLFHWFIESFYEVTGLFSNFTKWRIQLSKVFWKLKKVQWETKILKRIWKRK